MTTDIDARERRDQLAGLLDGFKKRMQSTSRDQLTASALNRYLRGFQDAVAHDVARESAESQKAKRDFVSFLAGYENALEAYRVAQERDPEHFNLLDVVHLAKDEITHSRLLAWLLHRTLADGTHAQGRLGFRVFLQQLSLPAIYANESYWVLQEVSNDQSRIDIEIAARGKFLIHIENKIESFEGTDQTDREWADLLARATLLGVSNSAYIHALYLTPSGNRPKNVNFIAISWRQIAIVVRKFAAACKAAEVALFASHYARSLENFCTPNEEGRS